MTLADIIGNTFINKDGKTVDVETLMQGKESVALYFSAHWCPPCRGFTPDFAEFYSKYGASRKFEVVFVSSDRSQDAFDEYLGEMPWQAVPYSERDLKAKLSRRFDVSGIPSVVILDKDGKTINKAARAKISADSDGSAWPYTPKTFWEMLPAEFVKNDGAVVTAADVKKDNDVVGIYFSAHWCPPCKAFTPKLNDFYKEHAANKKFEIIFVSSDRDEAAFASYHKEMAWPAVAFDNKAPKSDLDDAFGVSGIPTLVLVDAKTGKLITDSARGRVGDDADGTEWPYAPKAVEEMSGATIDPINSTPAVVIFSDDDKYAAHEAALKPLAQEIFDAANASDEQPEQVFFVAKADSIVDRVKAIMKWDDSAAVLAIVDISAKSWYKSDKSDVNDQVVRDFVADFKAGRLTKLPLHF